MYDETGAKAYESLQNNTKAMLQSPDVIDFAIASMILNIVDTRKVVSVNKTDIKTGIGFVKCKLTVNEDGSIECKNDSVSES